MLYETRGKIDPEGLDLSEKVIDINRVSKVVKGGRRFSFTSLVVVGDGNGHVGVSSGKANEVPEAIRKAIDRARMHLIRVPLEGTSIPHEIVGEFCAAKVLLKPASEGTGVIAGGPVRAVMDAVGIHDVLTKSLGTPTTHNVVKAAMDGLYNLMDPREVAERRGLELEELRQ